MLVVVVMVVVVVVMMMMVVGGGMMGWDMVGVSEGLWGQVTVSMSSLSLSIALRSRWEGISERMQGIR